MKVNLELSLTPIIVRGRRLLLRLSVHAYALVCGERAPLMVPQNPHTGSHVSVQRKEHPTVLLSALVCR